MTYDEIKNILAGLENQVEKLEFLMELGRDLPAMPAGVTGDEIKGCASNVSVYKDDNNNFSATADSMLVRGIIAILFSMVQGKSASSIRVMNLRGAFNDLGLQLGAGRLNGLSAIIQYLEHR